MHPVRSNHSNPALKQDLGKARFFAKRILPPTSHSSGGGNSGVEIVFAKPMASPALLFGGTQTLLLQNPVKKFATDKDE